MKQAILAPLVAAACLLVLIALTWFPAGRTAPVVAQGGVSAPLGPNATPTATPTTGRWCPTLTPESFSVDPVTSPTDLLGQTVVVHIGNGEAVTVTTESGIFTATGSFNGGKPALVDVLLLPNTRHNLKVAARVRSWYLWEGCTIGGYTLWTTGDRNGRPLVIEQQAGTITPTPTVSPTPTRCPSTTPEPLWVEPVISPTDLLTQTITVRIGNGEAVTVTAESGVFTATGSFSAYGNPARVTIDLLAGVTHNLEVQARVRKIEQAGCTYGGYTLSTARDRYGQPLVIEQAADHSYYLPLALK